MNRTSRPAAAALVLALAVTLALAACGKKGSPNAPGPPGEVIYPRMYPSPNDQ